VWASGDAYEPYVGRWSRLVAREFVQWLARPPGGAWLDVGCGTGALTEAILTRCAPSRVAALDRSVSYVEYARRRSNDPRLVVAVADAERLPCADAAFDASVSGLVLNFVERPQVAIAEMAWVVREGGTVAAYVWDYTGAMELMRYFWDAAVALDRGAEALDEGRRFALCRPDPLAALLRGAGLRDVEVRAIVVPTFFRSFDEYWTPFLGGQGPAPAYAMALSPERRAALRERVRARLPIGPDGAIRLSARAWAARGGRPGAVPR
jgi:SAM-dependent methyltransferase